MANPYSDCPKCGGTLNGGDWEADCEWVWRPITCENEDCGFEYQEVYQFICNETLRDCEELDDNGNVIKNITLSPIDK